MTAGPERRIGRGGPLSLDDLREQAAGNPAEMVLLALPDMQGRLMGKRLSVGHFLDNVAGGGTEFCRYLLATDIDMRPLDGFSHTSWEDGYGDMAVVPDTSTLRRLSWPGGGVVVMADVQERSGAAVAISPRTMLRRQLDLLARDHGLTVRTGLEAEFSLYHGRRSPAERDLRPVATHNLDYNLSHPHGVGAFLVGLEEALLESGLPLEATKTEAAPGQIEVTFRYGDPLAAADTHLLLKHTSRKVGDTVEVTPTFMASPETGIGNGLHVHLSLWDGDEPATPSDDDGLSATGQQAVAGLVQVLPQLMPLLLPTVNSYKRLNPKTFAPTHMAWGWDNRTCAVRVVGHGRGRHLEVRLPGADANPYLVLTAVVAACRHGLAEALTPPEPVKGNAYNTTSAPRLPRTLDAALAAFTASELAADLLGPEVVRHYSTVAEYEIDALSSVVTDAERQRGFSRV